MPVRGRSQSYATPSHSVFLANRFRSQRCSDVDAATHKVTPCSVTEQLDNLPILPFHRRLFFQVFAGLFFDIFDLSAAAAITAAMLATGWATLPEIAPLTSVTAAGMMVGSLAVGFVGDRFGRKIVFRWNLVVVGLASTAAALAPNIEWLLAARFVASIGLGAEAVLAYAAFSEFLPRASRGRWIGLMAMAGHTAVIVAALAGYFIIPHGGWRWLFAIGAAGAVLGLIARRGMPESPRWLLAKGRREEAIAIVSAISPNAAAPPRTEVQTVEAQGVAVSTVRAMIVAVSMAASVYISVYAFLHWLPSLMVVGGRALPHSLLIHVVMSSGAVVGAAASGYLADRYGRRPAVAGAASLSALIAIAYSLSPSPDLQAFFGFAMYASVYALSGVAVSIYLPELFATRSRLRGHGSAVTIGRICAVLAPLATPALYASGGVLAVALSLAGVLCVCVILVLSLGRETKGRALR